jgi:lipopolysaccharide export system permease protein
MSILARYMSRKVLMHAGLVLLSLATLSLTFELMERADNVLAASGGRALAVLAYAGLRLPDFVARQVPMAMLVGGLITFGLLRRYDELIAMWGSGVSVVGMMRALVPLGLLIGVCQLALDNVAVPAAQALLRERGLAGIGQKGLIEVEMSATWLRSGEDIIRIPKDAAMQGTLTDITIFRRDGDGRLVERLDAKAARPVAGGWQLTQVTRHTIEPAGLAVVPELVWQGHIDIGELPLLSSDERELTIGQLRFLIANDGFGQRPGDLYRTWLQNRIATAVAPLLILWLVVSLAQRFHRTGDFGFLIFSGLVLGFAFFVLDGAMFAMGEAALLPPWFAAWGAEIVLAALIGFLALRNEG